MKVNNYIIYMLLALFTLGACTKEYMAPPLNEPKTSLKANITIAKLKEIYSSIKDPKLIDVDYIVKGYVIGNDISGNIYKNLYIQDATGGISIGIDQNSLFTDYQEGQEVYIRLKGLYMVSYGDQLQIGYGSTNANRIPWLIWQEFAEKNKWPLADNITPKQIDLSNLDQSMVNTLVRLDNVYFVDGGKKTFSEPDQTTNRTLKDSNGRSIIVRNSNYASFANDLLPQGSGTVIGVLSKFRSDWQLFIRKSSDCQNFDSSSPGTINPPINVPEK